MGARAQPATVTLHLTTHLQLKQKPEILAQNSAVQFLARGTTPCILLYAHWICEPGSVHSRQGLYPPSGPSPSPRCSCTCPADVQVCLLQTEAASTHAWWLLLLSLPSGGEHSASAVLPKWGGGFPLKSHTSRGIKR